jgi:tetratricopeptide (TPR) repeat protein
VEALDIAEANDDTLGVAKARWGLANAHQVEQNFPDAHEQLLLAYDGFVAADDAFMTHWTNRELGIVEIELGRLDEARVHLEPALSFFSRSGDLSGTILLLRDHARLRAMEGEHRDAIKLLGAAQNQEAVAGLAVSQFELAAYGVADVAVDVTTEQARDLLEEGRGWSLDEAIAFAERSMVGT